jgi:ferredoxin, 2Fe-2S
VKASRSDLLSSYKVTFVHTDGREQVCEAPEGLSLLEVAHKNMIDIEGACEGSMACSTCHVIIDPDWYDKLEPAVEEEEDMLDLTFGLKRTSRLGCQIRMTADLDGLRVQLPKEHRNLM